MSKRSDSNRTIGIVIETQQWIDGVNHPEWGQDQYQIYSVDSEPAVVFAQYDFSILD